MSSFDFAREKTLTGREARAVGAAVARAARASEVGALVSELARTVRSAERTMAARGDVLEVVRSPLGVPVPVHHLLASSEGVAVSERMGRFFFIRPSARSPLLLPPWSVEDMALTRTGVRALNRSTNLRSVSEISNALRDLLATRESDARSVFASIPRGATGLDVLNRWPACSAAILRILRQ